MILIVSSMEIISFFFAIKKILVHAAGSEGDIAGSSSEGDEHRIMSLENRNTNSPFNRQQFPRDSGCYEASLKTTRQPQLLSPQDESDTSDNISSFTDNTNNLDAVVVQCNNEILAHMRQVQKNSLNLKDTAPIYQPNIPNNLTISNSSSSEKLNRGGGGGGGSVKEAYVSGKRGNKWNNIEESCEADKKMMTVKYVVGGSVGLGECDSAGKGCFSGKSSDSGFSSSSVCSSAIVKEPARLPVPNTVANFSNSANNCTTSNTAIQLLEQRSEKIAF